MELFRCRPRDLCESRLCDSASLLPTYSGQNGSRSRVDGRVTFAAIYVSLPDGARRQRELVAG